MMLKKADDVQALTLPHEHNGTSTHWGGLSIWPLLYKSYPNGHQTFMTF